jgi:translation initiation factor 2 beta subunit (eIF-2beta)/eIF-5
MDEPDFLICLSCDTPTYTFEYRDGKLLSVHCSTCGNDEPSDFMTEDEFETESE